MKILQINKFFYVRGGASRYFFNISNLLKSYGHEIAFFSMYDPQNKKSYWSKYFVSNISFEKMDVRNSLKIILRMFYSFETRRKIAGLLDEFHPDIVHLHNISHHLSPSIIFELASRKIPIVQTLHDYHLISPNYYLFHDDKICEITKPDKYYKAIFHRCVRNSYLASIAEVAEMYFQKILHISNYIDLFIAPGFFMERKLIEYGIAKNKIRVLNNFTDAICNKKYNNQGNYILYFGRLSPEKDIIFLLEVIKRLPEIKLKIVGSGNTGYEYKIKEYYRNNLKNLKNVEFIKFQKEEKLTQYISNCRFTVLTTGSYEIFPLSIIEAFKAGKPVIGSNIGGIPELIKDGFNGLLFKTGDPEDCARKISYLWNNYSLNQKLGKQTRLLVKKRFESESHYKKLLKIYNEARSLH